MNSYVASCAVLIAGIGHVMRRGLNRDAVSLASEVPRAVVTFQAQSKHNWAQQQARVGRSVRSVAGFASVDTNAEVLEYEGAALIGMAVETRLLVRRGLVYLMRARGH